MAPASTRRQPSHEMLLHTAVGVGVNKLVDGDPTICIYEEWQEIVSGGDRDQVSAVADEVAGELEATVKLVREDPGCAEDDETRELEGLPSLGTMQRAAYAIRAALSIYQEQHPGQLERERQEREALEAAKLEAERQLAAQREAEREAELARQRAELERDEARRQAVWDSRRERWQHLQVASAPAPRGAPTRPEKITVVGASDWQAVYLDGELIEEGQTVSAYELAEALGFHVEHGPEVDEEFLEYAGGMTARLEDLPVAPDR